jgi:hypothetical protein
VPKLLLLLVVLIAMNFIFAAKTGKQALLIEAKRLEAAFDRRLAELKSQGVDFNE